MKILGIDPGLASCGWAVVEVNNETSNGVKSENLNISIFKNYKLVCYGSIQTSSAEKISFRLKKIFSSLIKIIEKTNPDVVSIETQFYSKIAKNMISTYMSTGVIYLVCELKGLKIFEYSAKTVKSSITGYGSAAKGQLKKMVHLLLNLEKPIHCEHINDAIAVAICYIHYQPVFIGL